jgi:hypothetical protein
VPCKGLVAVAVAVFGVRRRNDWLSLASPCSTSTTSTDFLFDFRKINALLFLRNSVRCSDGKHFSVSEGSQ